MKKIILCLLIIFSACGSNKNVVKKKYKITKIENVEFSGGDGFSFEKAIIIKTKNSSKGIGAEYKYLDQKYGRRGIDWKMIQQSLSYKNKKPFDVLKIKYKGKEINVYFEISSFSGKY
ncbi:MAG: hypothetical protein V3V28_05240 [Polaribacter sp.]|uniref:hypothetical protein n=1 Tax=Polaribacter sp. TaxID=1920175 RepID=UPI002F350AC6